MTQKYIRELFNYNIESGILTYAISRNYRTVVGNEAGWLWVDKKRDSLHTYRHVKVDRQTYKVHRIIWVHVYGGIDSRMQVDHIDGNTLNNKIENLRLVSNAENSKNRSVQSNNTSGYHGINQLPSGNWRVRIVGEDRKRISIGSYSTFEEALMARKEAEAKYGYHTNHGRK